MKENRTEVERARMTKSEKETLELASKMSNIAKSDIIRNGMLKECKKILREIEKGK